MRRTYSGMTLIEVIIAAGVIAVGLFMAYYGLAQSQRIAERNDSTEVGLSILKNQIDADSKLDYSTVQTGTFTISGIPELANSQIVRTTTLHNLGSDSSQGIKIMNYVLTWTGSDGQHKLQADYELVQHGLDN